MRMLIRRRVSSLKLFDLLRKVLLREGCSYPVIRDVCQWVIVESILPIWQEKAPAPWGYLCWKLGWLSSNRRGRCLLSGGLRRWVSGSRLGIWRVWLQCKVFFICCWWSVWVYRCWGIFWWLVLGRVIVWIPFNCWYQIVLWRKFESITRFSK